MKLTAVCMECFREAAYTKRLGLEKEVPPLASAQGVGGLRPWRLSPTLTRPSLQVEVIGGADKYHSVCRQCYFKKSSAQTAETDNKENCLVLGQPAEASAVRKLFAPQQVLQYNSAN